MSWESDLERFTVKLDENLTALVPNVAEAMRESIVSGSPTTGAPGSPVDTGALRASWHTEIVSPEVARIVTNIEYAPYVEDGISRSGKPMNFRVGGPHSVALTLAGGPKLVAQVVQEST